MNEFEKYIQHVLRPEVIVRPTTNTSTRVLRHSYSAKKPSTRLTPLYRRHKQYIPPVIDFASKRIRFPWWSDNYIPSNYYLHQDKWIDLSIAPEIYNLDIIDYGYNNKVIRASGVIGDTIYGNRELELLYSYVGLASRPNFNYYESRWHAAINAFIPDIDLEFPHDLERDDIHSLLSSAVLSGKTEGYCFSYFKHKELRARPAAIRPIDVTTTFYSYWWAHSSYTDSFPIYHVYFANVSNTDLIKLSREFQFPAFPKIKARENILTIVYTITDIGHYFQLTDDYRYRQAVDMTKYVIENMRIRVGPFVYPVANLPVKRWGAVWQYINSSFDRHANIRMQQITGYPYAHNPFYGFSLYGEYDDDWSLSAFNVRLNPSFFDPTPSIFEFAFTIVEQIYLFEYSVAPRLAINSSVNNYSKVANLTYYHRNIVAESRWKPVDNYWGWTFDYARLFSEDLPNRLKDIFKVLNKVSIKIPLYIAYSHSTDILESSEWYRYRYILASKDHEINRISQVLSKYKNKLPPKRMDNEIPWYCKVSTFSLFPSYNFEVPYDPDVVDLAIPQLKRIYRKTDKDGYYWWWL